MRKAKDKSGRMSAQETLELWQEYKRTGDAPYPRPSGPDVRADGQVHRVQEGARDPGPVRGGGFHLVRPGGADPVDRPVRPQQGRHARAVRVDPDPRRRARRAPPQRLGASLAAPLGSRHQQGQRAVRRPVRPQAHPAGAERVPRDLDQGPDHPAGRHRALPRRIAEHGGPRRGRHHDRADRHVALRRSASAIPSTRRCVDEAKARFREAFERLPERERKVAVLLYVYNLTLREIGEILGVTESRVCQIHGQITKKLRTELEVDEALFSEVA